jgi:hypothetical protein
MRFELMRGKGARDARPAAVRWLTASALVAALSACTTVGVHTKERASVDYGPSVQLRVCVLSAPKVTRERVDALILAVNREFEPYAITVTMPWVRPWARPGFTVDSIVDDVIRRDLEAPCDRLVALVDRNAGDFLWGLVMPEILGAVEENTHTHGYIVATAASLNQLVMDPSAATVHEFYHLLGCPHSLSMSKCYGIIAALKHHADPGADFFPGITSSGSYLQTRDAVNEALRAAVAGKDAARHPPSH